MIRDISVEKAENSGYVVSYYVEEFGDRKQFIAKSLSQVKRLLEQGFADKEEVPTAE
jgi:phage pi2 protein 07